MTQNTYFQGSICSYKKILSVNYLAAWIETYTFTSPVYGSSLAIRFGFIMKLYIPWLGALNTVFWENGPSAFPSGEMIWLTLTDVFDDGDCTVSVIVSPILRGKNNEGSFSERLTVYCLPPVRFCCHDKVVSPVHACETAGVLVVQHQPSANNTTAGRIRKKRFMG